MAGFASGTYYKAEAVAVIALVALMLTTCVNWKALEKGIHWGVLLLMGGGLTLADVLRQRIRNRERAGSDISEADLSVLEHQLATYAGLDAD
ncbi:MAG TPA: hypothetical protein VIN66_06815 [Rheinheimera sp.]|uniref:hypothetical protein n=1 Tax=Rheinheimera sp. TaxID=1869214 RepID=UPI002F94AB64